MKKLRVRVKLEGHWISLGTFPVPADSVLARKQCSKRLGWPFNIAIVFDLEVIAAEDPTP